MGGAASKGARTLPKRAPPTWAGARAVQQPTEPTILNVPAEPSAIEKYAFDPHFLSNLSRMGQVKVDHHMQAVQPANDATQIFERRRRAEEEAFSLQHQTGRIDAYSLTDLLDARKSCTSAADLRQLAENYRMDPSVVEELSRSVNSPSVDRNRVRTVIGKDGEELVSVTAAWINPPIARP
ncbi:hypothetical protein PC9H_001112 [Pleurotus ostreatus]|uniref:Uncharacterized protein n=1 Tax=Pleurotus ostreatus TaxID=5322 RepID=A0A8H7DVX0_PLEOS|nr:uncharacterized protein PC9H_001112 [Pleurotus ostreatus]KAF7440764.1 hypothetical protein PC9H_001112 [Pleurotus ostreatus]